MNSAEDSVDRAAVLTCYTCRRRKVKCDRILPICTPCRKSNRECEFPLHQLKPGPRPGSLRRERHAASQPRTIPSPDSTRRQRSIPQQSPTETRSNVGLGEVPSSDPAAASFSEFTYPSHEGQTRPATPSSHAESPQTRATYSRSLDGLCQNLEISGELCTRLLNSYFANMTAFSLFPRGRAEQQLAGTPKLMDAEALLAAMFSFSARFEHTSSNSTGAHDNACPLPSYFALVASQKITQSLDECGDAKPSFCILQAHILLAFYELTRSVRSKSWRVLGQCIRIAYEMKLHVVDQDLNTMVTSVADPENIDIEEWIVREEKRRVWWAIWEMDVFASTIRRLPTAIDWTQNLTLLPVSDQHWFEKSYQKSCFLFPDPSLRWKALVESGNKSGKAWFILINSLMRNTQIIVYSPSAPQANRTIEDREVDLMSMANALFCTVSSLPEELAYHGEVLNFQQLDAPTMANSQLQQHSDKYSLHLMTQLSHFMINHHQIRARAPWLSEYEDGVAPPPEPLHRRASDAEWINYMSASEEIITVIRNSARHHYRHVNPFLVNTLWFAAAAQCSCRVFGPSSLTRERRLADSNLDLLRLTIDRFITFWGSTEMLKDKLARMEYGLKGLMEQQNSFGNARTERQQLQEGRDTDEGRGRTTVDLMSSANNVESVMASNDWISTLAPDNTMGRSAFDGTTDYFPFGLDDLLMPYNADFLEMGLQYLEPSN